MIERRQNIRKEIRIPIKYQHDNITHGVLTRDVSAGGMSIIANHFIPKSTKIVITAMFSFLDDPLKIPASVAWVSSEAYNEQYRIGIHFEEIHPETKEQIDQFVIQQ